MTTYKAIHSLAPQNITQLNEVKQQHRSLRSGNAILLQHPAIKTFKNLGGRSFSMAALTECNRLVPVIRNSLSLEIFKNRLKTHLFKEAFNSAE